MMGKVQIQKHMTSVYWIINRVELPGDRTFGDIIGTGTSRAQLSVVSSIKLKGASLKVFGRRYTTYIYYLWGCTVNPFANMLDLCLQTLDSATLVKKAAI